MPLTVTVIGHDRPGIIAEVTSALAGLGLNLEDSSMTLLRGHFAWMLVCAGPYGADEVAGALAQVGADGSLVVSVREVPPEPDPGGRGRPHVVTVHGGDRPGIVAAIAGTLAAAGGNITDLSTRLAGELYVVVAEVDLPDTTDVDALATRLREVGAGLGVGVGLRPADADLL